jgi:hypothetical protein
MAQYRVLQKSFINNALREEGEIVEYDGDPSDNLELVKKSKKGAGAPVDSDQKEEQTGE